MTWLPHHTNIKARVIGIQGSTLKQLYNRRLDVDEGRFTYQLMRINTMHLKCAWARQSIGLDQRIDNHVSITITKRNFDDLIIPAATGGFGIKEQGLAGIVQSVALLELFENSNKCVLGGYLTHERLACM